MNTYKLDRYEDTYAVLVLEDDQQNELSILKERLITFANPGDVLAIEFDDIGSLKQVEILSKA